MINVIFDINVYYASYMKDRLNLDANNPGLSTVVLDKSYNTEVEVYISDHIMSILKYKLKDNLGITNKQANEINDFILHGIASSYLKYANYRLPPLSLDPEDARVIDLAIDAYNSNNNDTYIVTYDLKDFTEINKSSEFPYIKAIHPKEFLRKILPYI